MNRSRMTLLSALLATGAAPACLAGPDPLYVLDGEASGDFFGYPSTSIDDVDADGIRDLLIGAPEHDTAGDSAGRVYLFSGADGSPIDSLDGSAANDEFGLDTAPIGDIDGDGVGDFAVGAPGYGASEGRVYVYSGATRSPIGVVDAPAPSMRFGVAIDPAGDMDGDGVPDFLVGASAQGFDLAGRVHVVSGANLSILSTLVGDMSGDVFGGDVAGGVDVDGDGTPDILVGAWRRDEDRGRVQLFSGATMTPLQTYDGDAPGHFYGFFVEFVGDVDADGTPDFAGVSLNHSAFAPDAGRVVVYSGDAGFALHLIGGKEAGDTTGGTIIGVGDVNDDGYDDVLVGTPNAAEANVVVRSGLDLSVLIEFEVPEGVPVGITGEVIGDVDGDGVDEVVIGATLADGMQPTSGQAYVYPLAFQEACVADVNEDGILNILDFVAFQNLFTAGCP